MAVKVCVVGVGNIGTNLLTSLRRKGVQAVGRSIVLVALCETHSWIDILFLRFSDRSALGMQVEVAHASTRVRHERIDVGIMVSVSVRIPLVRIRLRLDKRCI